MNKTLKKILVASCAAATVLSMAACGSSSNSGDANTIKFQTWNLKNDTFTPYFNEAIAQFEKDNPGTKIEWVDQPGENYDQKLSTDAAAGQLPDVVNVSETQGYNLAKAGALLNLSEEMPDAADDYLPQVWKGSTFKGNGIDEGVYGFPWYLNIDVAYINKPLFEQCGLDPDNPPKTYDELFEQANTFAENCASQGKYFLAIPRIMTSEFEEYGVDTLNKDHSEFTLNSAKGVEYVQKYVDLYKKGAFPKDGLTSNTISAEKLYFQGNIAYMPNSTSSIASFKTNAPDLYKNLDVAQLVTNNDNTINPMTVAVSSQTKNKELSLKFANYITNKENQLAFGKLANVFPSAAGSMDDEYYHPTDTSKIENKIIEVASKEIDNGDTGNRAPEVSDSDDTNTISPQIAKAILGQQTAKQAMDNIVKTLNEKLGE